MEFRDSFSRLKKKVKHGLTGKKPKPKKTGANGGGESANSTGSRPATRLYTVAGGSHDQGGKEPNAGGGQVLSMIRLSQSDEQGSMPARGSADDQGNRESDVDIEEFERVRSHLHSADVGFAEGSGPAREKGVDGMKVEQIYPSRSATSTPDDGKPDGT